MKIQIDQSKCQGHQSCAIAAPKVYGSDEIGNALLLIEGDVPEELQASALRGQANCPERAITIED